MSRQTDDYKKDKYVSELEQLTAFKRLADTKDGQAFIKFVLDETRLSEEPHTASKNSGETANILGKQHVGRAIIDKLIQAGVEMDCTVFSSKNRNRIAFITAQINRIIGGKK
jgi:hypothetical protein